VILGWVPVRIRWIGCFVLCFVGKDNTNILIGCLDLAVICASAVDWPTMKFTIDPFTPQHTLPVIVMHWENYS